MDSSETTVNLIFLISLICMSGFFSASETALMSVNGIKLRNLVEDGVKKSDIVLDLIQDQGRLLSSILIGNNVVNILSTALATSLFVQIFSESGVAAATITMTVVVLIFGEIVPKTIAKNNPEAVSIAVARIILLFMKFIKPVVLIFEVITAIVLKVLRIDKSNDGPVITEEELKTMVNVSMEEGVLEGDETEIINNVFDFRDILAKEIMIQRTDIASISKESSYNEVVEIFTEDKFSRVPVYEDNLDYVVGILNIKDIAFIDEEEKKDFVIDKYLRTPIYTYEYKRAAELLNEMKLEKVHIAVVLDEYGGTAGIITIEDLVEQIVGNIEDEYDCEEESITRVEHGKYIVLGSTKIDYVNTRLGLNVESDEFDSIGGYVMGCMKKIPEDGDSIECEGFNVMVQSIDKNRINKIEIVTFLKEDAV